MIVNNHTNQIKEAYRVLKNNGIAVFTVWGNPEKCEMFSLLDEVINKHFPGSLKPNVRSNFHLYEDKGEKLKNDLISVGFKGIKIWE